MKISTIVPVYNGEKYIGRCIESVLAQTYTKWELILIDDGSNDKTLEILKYYERNDERIIVVHQNNMGPGMARNRGLDYATGDYVVFIDSDDTITEDYFFKLSKEHADVVFIDVNQVDETFGLLKEEHLSKYKKMKQDDLIRSQMTSKIPWGGCRKAVRNKFLKDNDIIYTEHKVGEEAVYSFQLLFKANSVSFLNGVVYNYVNRVGSQSDILDDDPWGEVVIAIKQSVTQEGVYDKYADTINAFLYTATIVSLQRLALYYPHEEYIKKANARLSRFYEDIDKNYSIDFKHVPMKAMLLYPFFRTHNYEAIRYISYWHKTKKK